MLQIKYLSQEEKKEEKKERILKRNLSYTKRAEPKEEKKIINFRYHYYKNFKKKIFYDYIRKYPLT